MYSSLIDLRLDNGTRLVKFSKLHNGKNRKQHSPTVSKVSFPLKGTVLFANTQRCQNLASGQRAKDTGRRDFIKSRG